MCASQGKRINVGPISGFPEWSPSERIAEQHILDSIRTTFERYSFSPIETPSVERNEVLTAKSGRETERQIYRLTSLNPTSVEDAREYSLHFDLTVPLARYMAQHYGELVFPFRRYQIQKVWRGERSQHGRFREFTQCDIDIVGEEKLSLMADAEIPAVISDLFSKLNIGPFVIRISNRKILIGYLEHLGFTGEQSANVLREVDKIERQGADPAKQYLDNLGIDVSITEKILALVQMDGTSQEIIKELSSWSGISERFEEGVSELKTVVDHADGFGIPEGNLAVDLGIVRGLDYYTGTIYETRLVEHPQLGSICSGGRYDDLASYFISRKLPGVGISIGLSRLFSQLLQAGVVQAEAATVAPVLVTVPQEDLLNHSIKIASTLRSNGIGTEIFFEASRLARQLRYASRKGFRFAVIPWQEDLEQGNVKIRDMTESKESIVSLKELASEFTKLLSKFNS